jgi:acyl-CoA thioester hydrolase
MGAIFEHPVDVRWRDVDALGHANHAVFLTYLEEGRDAFYTQTLGSDPLYVVARLGTTSLTTRETIVTPSGEAAAEARVVTVRWDAVRRMPVPFSEASALS